MTDPTQTPVVQACAYAALVIASLAMALDAPMQLIGLPGYQSLPYAACFVAAIWLSSFLIPSPWRLSLAVVIATLVWAAMMQLIILAHDNDAKETLVVLAPFGRGSGPPVYMQLAYIVAATLLLVPLLLRRSYPAPDFLRLARVLLMSFAGLLAVVTILSLAGMSRFFDPFKALLTPYIFPLMASATAVLLWEFLRKNVFPKGTPNA